jgi:mono/diheme cytochrome c family protein
MRLESQLTADVRPVRSRLKYLVVILIALALGAFWFVWRPALAALPQNASLAFDARSIARGADLATLGNCADCHTVPGLPLYSGGYALKTPFGTIFGSNLTPDRETGIGKWSEEAFRRAMREGVDRQGSHLYPAFPYDHFTRVTDADIKDIYAFLMSRPAVFHRAPANELNFPFNIRPILAGWKLLFLHKGMLANDASKSEEWNRGRYLAEGLGHCGSCHTPRNILGGEKKGKDYAGGIADGWNAPALNALSASAHPWTADDLTVYLTSGWHHLHGAAAGPMADVTKNLGRSPAGDTQAIATYIISLSENRKPAPGKGSAPADRPAGPVATISSVFEGACARCHSSQRGTGPSLALDLSLSTEVQSASPTNVVRAIMEGIPSYRANGGPYMPSFATMLSDEQIAALTRYVRARYTDHPAWNGIKEEIAKARQEGAKP